MLPLRETAGPLHKLSLSPPPSFPPPKSTSRYQHATNCMTRRATAGRTFVCAVLKLRPISVQCQYRRCLDRISLLAHRQHNTKTTTTQHISVVRPARVHPCHTTTSSQTYYPFHLRRSRALSNNLRVCRARRVSPMCLFVCSH